MLPPFSCFFKCHSCGTQVVGHVLLGELGVPWAQHRPWLRPSAVTQPKIPPGVFPCQEQGQAVASWPWRGYCGHQNCPGIASSQGGAWGLGEQSLVAQRESCFLGKLLPWAALPCGLGRQPALQAQAAQGCCQFSASHQHGEVLPVTGNFDHRNSPFDLVPRCVASPSEFSFFRALFSPWDFTLFLHNV